VKKCYLILSMLGSLALACATPSLIPATPTLLVQAVSQSTETLPLPTSVPTETPVPTSTSAPSVTPTELTPTIVSIPTWTSTAFPTGTVVSLATIIQVAPTSLIQPTPQGPVFESVTTSGTQINWGDTCDENLVTVTAQVASGFNVTSVLLFTRLQSQNGNNTTGWNNAISMHDDGFGTYTYDLSTKVLRYYQDFNMAWVQYQLVATNIQQKEAGRTQIYLNSLLIKRCSYIPGN
jgi:hypothetical protein